MTFVQEQAIEKLTNEQKLTDAGKVEKAIAADTAKALMEFCRQSADFAAAVYNGGSFEECCKSIAKGVGGSISDFEVFRRAVRHYMPQADIKYKMEITAATSTQSEPLESKVLNIDFDLGNFLD